MSRGKNRQAWHCRRCKKKAFGSESRALESSANRTQVFNTDPQRAYPCPIGNGWHLTKEKART